MICLLHSEKLLEDPSLLRVTRTFSLGLFEAEASTMKQSSGWANIPSPASPEPQGGATLSPS